MLTQTLPDQTTTGTTSARTATSGYRHVSHTGNGFAVRNNAPAILGPVDDFSRKSLAVTACCAALLTPALAGCASSDGTGGPTASGSRISKADFIAKANALCTSTHTSLHAAQPSGATDYPGILAFDAKTLKEEPIFIAQVTALADKSPDKAALHAQWIDLNIAQFNAQKPLIAKVDAAATARDQSQLIAAVQQVAALPENDKVPGEIDYLNKYGLTACASLTANGSQ